MGKVAVRNLGVKPGLRENYLSVFPLAANKWDDKM